MIHLRAVIAIATAISCCSAATADLVVTDWEANTLLNVDANSGAGTTIAGLSPDLFGLAFDQNTETFYGSSAFGGAALYTVNATNGQTAAVGTIAGFDNVSGLAFDASTNTLFGVAGGTGPETKTLLSINTSTGSATTIGDIRTSFSQFNSLAFDSSSSTLFGVEGLTDELFAINTTTGLGTSVGSVGFGNIVGLGYDSDVNVLYGVDSATGQLISINTASGAGTAIGVVGASGPPGATSFGGFTVGTVSGVPEPSSFLLLGVVGAGVAAVRRRKRVTRIGR